MRQSLYRIVLIGLFSSLVFVTTSIKFVIPIPGGYTMAHLGHVSCLLAGMLLPSTYGAISAALGSSLFDLFSPLFLTSTPFTFLFKFILAFTCGKIYRIKKVGMSFKLRVVLASLVSSLIYLVLHILKLIVYNFYFLNVELYAVGILVLKSVAVSLLKDVVTFFLVTFIMEKIRKLNLFTKLNFE